MSAFARVNALQHRAQPAERAAISQRCNTCQFDAENQQDLRKHYKSEWHVHNSRRRASNQPPVTRAEFKAKVRETRSTKRKSIKPVGTAYRATHETSARGASPQAEEAGSRKDDDSAVSEATNNSLPEPSQDIDEFTCIFDRRKFSTVEDNVEYCHRQYGLFIPDREYVVDLPGLICYLNEKVKLGHICLYCQKQFPTITGCQRHMIDKSHCKLRYEDDVDVHEYEEFYDFSSSYGVMAGKYQSTDEGQEERKGDGLREQSSKATEGEGEGEEDEWSDIEDDDAWQIEKDEELIITRKLAVTDIGELMLLDGRIVGHREYRHLYRQRIRPRRIESQPITRRPLLTGHIHSHSQAGGYGAVMRSLSGIRWPPKGRKARWQTRNVHRLPRATVDPSGTALIKRDFNNPR